MDHLAHVRRVQPLAKHETLRFVGHDVGIELVLGVARSVPQCGLGDWEGAVRTAVSSSPPFGTQLLAATTTAMKLVVKAGITCKPSDSIVSVLRRFGGGRGTLHERVFATTECLGEAQVCHLLGLLRVSEDGFVPHLLPKIVHDSYKEVSGWACLV